MTAIEQVQKANKQAVLAVSFTPIRRSPATSWTTGHYHRKNYKSKKDCNDTRLTAVRFMLTTFSVIFITDALKNAQPYSLVKNY